MTAPNLRRQNEARKVLDELFDRPDKVCVIHYSCESFYDREEGRSPRITSIAVRRLDSAQTISFSIHQTAEVSETSFGEIRKQYNKLEFEMLRRFFAHLKALKETKYLHWNMRDSNYGFQAIDHRFRVLQGQGDDLHVVDDKDKVDLPRILHDIYGADYIGHPRLEQLLKKNGIGPRDFLPGAEEAKAFEEQRFADLHLSTLRKVDVIADIALRAHDGNLKTDTSWRAMRGGGIVTILRWLGSHPIFSIAVGIVGVVSLVLSIVFRFWP